MDQISEFIPSLLDNLGLATTIFVMWYLGRVSDDRRWDRMQRTEDERRDREAQERESDREEHMQKWRDMMSAQEKQFDTLMKTHGSEVERQYQLFNRLSGSLDLMAGHTQRIAELVKSNQFCPKVREAQGE